jgi:hypothetical protein
MQPVRDVIDSMPIVRAWRALKGRREHSALALLMLLAFYATLSLMTPSSLRLQRRLLEAHHYRPQSMASWITLQLAPKMYGFAHRVWIGGYALYDVLPRETADYRFEAQHFWVNHYPARRARFDGFREAVFGRPVGPRYLYLQTSYRGFSESSGFVVSAKDGHLRIRRLDKTP